MTDGDQRAALAVVRSLGMASHEVHVCGPRTPALAGASRFATSEHSVPDPLAAPGEFADAIAARVEATGSELLLPVSDASVTAILTNRHLFERVALPFPSYESYRDVSDKGAVATAATDVGLRVPRQVVLPHGSTETQPDMGALDFPLVVKPVRSVVADAGRLRKTKVTYAASAEELEQTLGALPEEAFPVLVQERVQGWGIGIFVLLWDGELLAAFAHRRLREKPPSGGVSVLRESIPVPPGLLERSRLLLERFDWRGIAMVEYKGASAESEPVLMEVNGRFWGSLQLAVDSGVDFPRLLASVALGERVEPVTTYRTGVRCRWFWGDVDHLIARIRHSNEALDLPRRSPGRIRAGWEFIKSFGPGTRSEVLRWSDPAPALRETLNWLRGR